MDVCIKFAKNHYEVFIDGMFYCSADNMREAEDEIQKFVNKRRKVVHQ